MQAHKPPNIAFVALDILKTDAKFSEYQEQPFNQKIQLLKAEIKKICQQLKAKEDAGLLDKNSMWIIGFREYALRGVDRDDLFFDKDMRKAFKAAMAEVTKDHPQLTLITGTLPTVKTISDDKKQVVLNQMKSNYAALAEHYKDEESNFANAEFNLLNKKLNKDKKFKMEIVRNSCFVFQKGENVWTRSKTTPFKETNKGRCDLVFHPGRFDNMVKALKHPNPAVADVSVGIEICREHGNGVLSKHHKQKPQLHLIVSDHIGYSPNYAYGGATIHIDSRKAAIKADDPNASPIVFYRYNLLDPPAVLISEEEAKILVENIKKYIENKNWSVKNWGIFGGRTIKVNNQDKIVPTQVGLQMLQINQAQVHSSYTYSLGEMVKIARNAAKNYEEDGKRSPDTQEYYKMFEDINNLRKLKP